MLQRSRNLALAGAIGVLLLPTLAEATNGYFAHGWGTQAKAMAGAAAALPQDSLVSATNPAGTAFIGQRWDLGAAFFKPSPRGYEANPDFATGPYPGGPDNFPTGGFVTPGRYDSDSDWFVIPSLGYNRELNDRVSVGMSLYGNGGMKTDYQNAVWGNFAVAPGQRVAIVDGQQLPLFDFSTGQPVPITDSSITQIPVPGGNGELAPVVDGNPNGTLTASTPTGVNLEQLFIEFPIAVKIGDGRQAFGIAPVLAAQRFEAKGLEPFRAASVNPNKVTNNGKDWSYGAGLHFGWYGEVSDRLALGLAYRTKIWMSKLDEYSGLFADGGRFDIPAKFDFGLAYRIRPDLTVAFDYQHIFYNEIDSIANSNDIDLTPCFAGDPKPSYCLGGKSGLGFGWDSMDVLKLGIRWQQGPKWTLLGGISYNSDFLKTDQQALFNILTPATVRWHLTAGATYRHGPKDEISLSFAYMPKEEVDGTSPSITQTQTGSLYMEQMEIELSWSHRF